jgi:hypothetical protein
MFPLPPLRQLASLANQLLFLGSVHDIRQLGLQTRARRSNRSIARERCHHAVFNSEAVATRSIGFYTPRSSIRVNVGGMTVSEAFVNYQTNEWTQGNAPATKSGPAGNGQPWAVTRICYACASAPTTPATFTAVGTSSVSASLISTPSSVAARGTPSGR